MNTHRTDHEAYEYHMPRARFRQILIESQLPKERIYYYRAPAGSLWECLKLTAFAMIMLGGLAEAIMWGLR